jgi:hypothetical protein
MKTTKSALITILFAIGACLSSNLYAGGPVVDPDLLDRPRVHGDQSINNQLYACFFNSIEALNAKFDVVIKNENNEIVYNDVINIEDIPSISFLLEIWNPGTYTIYVNNECGRTIAVE